MKAILGSLLCFVLFASESFALKGGPPYPGGTVNLAGTYSAILVPTNPSKLGDTLALFTLVVPQTGLASGTVAVFTRGIFYSGTIQGLADPKTAKLYAVINAIFTPPASSDTGTGTPPPTPSLAAGELTGNKIIAPPGFSGTAFRITGDATLTYTSEDHFVTDVIPDGTSLKYAVLGFKQA